MAKQILTFLDRVYHHRILRRWSRWAEDAENVDLKSLRMLRRRGRQISARVNELLYVSEGRLALPHIGSNAIQTPPTSDWAWRPELWRGPLTPRGQASVASKTEFGQEVTVFHDCNISEINMRQLRNQRAEDLAPFGFRVEVFRFDGSFLSLVIELPKEATQGLKRNHLVRLNTTVELERPAEISARLNVKNGPNTDQFNRDLELEDGHAEVDFDLSYSEMNENRVERVWVDLVIKDPEMNQIILRDITFSRRPRAEL
ncbi:DUF6478 family protein [Falsihalocynthiibacter sp. SS001]|uniref:DUF6478 family protein n=1 Tax=Falsihalocynthiibacter sp. SS001 TaxID=3349698 RepID=UPI0036D373FE